MSEISKLEAEVKRLRAALFGFMAMMNHYGEWDDGCFYYHGHSATELQNPIENARAVLAEGATK